MSLDVNLQNEDHHPRQLVKVLDSVMSYVDIGSGSPIIFLHGNPTSSYLWRNIIPYAAELGRCLAPDLIGMGGSSPSPKSSYRFEDHSRYLDAWFDALGIDGNVILVLHDWGSALGFYRAFRRPEQVRAIVYMESILQPRNWSDFTVERGQQFRALRSGEGERMIFDENFAIESIVPASVIRTLSTSEMNAYRAPFAQREARLPTLIWPRELPIEGRPADVTEIVEQYAAWLKDESDTKTIYQRSAWIHHR